jgi:hypothetical protein
MKPLVAYQLHTTRAPNRPQEATMTYRSVLGICLVASSISATAQDDIFRVVVGEPTFGISDTGPQEAPVALSRRITSEVGTADTAGQSSVGSVGVNVSGVFDPIEGFNSAFGPTATAAYRGHVTFSGPGAGSIPTTFANFELRGTFDITEGENILVGLGNVRARVFIGGGFVDAIAIQGNGSTYVDFPGPETGIEVEINDTGPDLIQGRWRTGPISLPADTRVVPIEMMLSVDFQFLSTPAPGDPTSFGGGFANSLSWATEGPVFDLPSGWTVNGAGLVDNRFIEDEPPPPTSVPEPSTFVLVAIASIGLLNVLRRRQHASV